MPFSRTSRPTTRQTTSPSSTPQLALTSLRVRRGHLETLKDQRYMDLERLAPLEQQVVAATQRISQAAIGFLQGDEALTPIVTQLGALAEAAEAAERAADLPPLAADLDLERLDMVFESSCKEHFTTKTLLS